MGSVRLSVPVLIGFYLYIEYLVCMNGQYNDEDDTRHDDNYPKSSTTGSSSHDGDTAIMGFLVITLCCLFGCCINICLRSSRRRRRRRRMRAINHNNAIQLFTMNNESNDEFEENIDDISCNETSKEGDNTYDTGIMINLDDTEENTNNLQNIENAQNRIDIEAIKREKTICVICHDELSGNVRILDCNHIFCQNCIKKWEKEGKCLCPICRQPTCSKKYINKKKKKRSDSNNNNNNNNNRRVVIITQNRNNGSHNVHVLSRNNTDLAVTMPVHAFLL